MSFDSILFGSVSGDSAGLTNSSYFDMINLFCSSEIVFDDLEETRKVLNNIGGKVNLPVIERQLIKNLSTYPLREIRSHLLVIIVENLKSTIAELYDFMGRGMVQFMDPITNELMTDPVIVEETGDTYESKSIIQHFLNSDTDPLSGRILRSKRFVEDTFTKRKIIERVATLAEFVIHHFGNVKALFKFYHSNIIIVGHYPLKITENRDANFHQIHTIMENIIEVLWRVSKYLEHENIEILELLDFYILYSFLGDTKKTKREKLERLLLVRFEISKVTSNDEKRIEILEKRILSSLPSEILTNDVKADIYFQLLILHKYFGPNEILKILPQYLPLIKNSSQKRIIVENYRKVFPNNRYLKIECIPFMNSVIEKSRTFYEIAKYDFNEEGENDDLPIEEFLQKSILLDPKFYEAHGLLYECYLRKCRRYLSPPKVLLEKVVKQALILLNDKTTSRNNMKYLERAYACFPNNDPKLREDIIERCISSRNLENIADLIFEKMSCSSNNENIESSFPYFKNSGMSNMIFMSLMRNKKRQEAEIASLRRRIEVLEGLVPPTFALSHRPALEDGVPQRKKSKSSVLEGIEPRFPEESFICKFKKGMERLNEILPYGMFETLSPHEQLRIEDPYQKHKYRGFSQIVARCCRFNHPFTKLLQKALLLLDPTKIYRKNPSFLEMQKYNNFRDEPDNKRRMRELRNILIAKEIGVQPHLISFVKKYNHNSSFIIHFYELVPMDVIGRTIKKLRKEYPNQIRLLADRNLQEGMKELFFKYGLRVRKMMDVKTGKEIVRRTDFGVILSPTYNDGNFSNVCVSDAIALAGVFGEVKGVSHMGKFEIGIHYMCLGSSFFMKYFCDKNEFFASKKLKLGDMYISINFMGGSSDLNQLLQEAMGEEWLF